MNKIIKLVVIFFVSNLFADMPSWYYHLPINPAKYIGYGEGKSEKEAKQNALNDIASQISTKVDSNIKKQTLLKDDKISKNLSISSSQSSKALLSDTKVIKFEKKDEIYYIAIEYENIPTVDKFIKKLSHSTIKTNHLNSYLSKTYLAKEIYKKLNKKITLEIVKKDRLWYIKNGNILQLLNKRDLAKLFATINNKNITITTNTNKNILYDGDEYYFNIRSTQDGFVSILSVYEDMTVSSLITNIPIKANQATAIPDKDFESVLEAGLIKNGVETYDLYIAIYSKNRVSFDMFAVADENLISDDKYKNFDELIKLLDDFTFSTIKIITKPR